MQYRREIDGLRAVAVLPVILFHGGFEIFSGGFVGVDVFFVISGYLITTILLDEHERGQFSIARFYERRARRILPVLFVVLAACLPFAWLWLIPRDLKDFAQSVVAVNLFSSNLLFWHESGYFDTAAELKPLLHTWSLAVEEQYYLLFPVFLAVSWHRSRRWMTRTLVLVTVASFLMAQWWVRRDPSGTFYLPVTRCWELLIGSLLAIYLARPQAALGSLPWRNAVAAAGLLLVVIPMFLYDRTTPFPGVYALAPTLGAALVIAFARPDTIAGKALGLPVFVGIGLISYSAYLWHQPLFAFARHRSSEPPATSTILLLCFLTFLLSYLSWRVVEQPFRAKGAVDRTRLWTFAATCSLLFVSLGVAAHLTNGFNTKTLTRAASYFDCAEHMQADGLCVFGNMQSEKVVALVGDSHAHHLSNALAKMLGREYKLVLIECGSCFLGDRVRFDGMAAKFGNSAEIARARRAMAALGKYDVHVLIRSQRWSAYGIETPEQVRSAVQDAFGASGIPYRRLIVVGATANVDFRCHAMKYYRGYERTCLRDTASERANEEFMHTTRAMVAPPNVAFVYPYEILCPGGDCEVIRGDVMLYRDSHHLTENGAELVMREIQRIIAAPLTNTVTSPMPSARGASRAHVRMEAS
jgi:peptidoglycan/LPS O-acetylase OafA/YrhL